MWAVMLPEVIGFENDSEIDGLVHSGERVNQRFDELLRQSCVSMRRWAI
jgi:hypothetical protein